MVPAFAHRDNVTGKTGKQGKLGLPDPLSPGHLAWILAAPPAAGVRRLAPRAHGPVSGQLNAPRLRPLLAACPVRMPSARAAWQRRVCVAWEGWAERAAVCREAPRVEGPPWHA